MMLALLSYMALFATRSRIFFELSQLFIGMRPPVPPGESTGMNQELPGQCLKHLS
jgi:hypothetical protein